MMRAALALLLLLPLAAVPGADAALCVGGACVADETYRAPYPCDGSWHVTGAWVVTSDVYVYAMGERRDCMNGWSGLGGEGLRIGVVVVGSQVEARWYEHRGAGCETGVEAARYEAGGPCLLPPPALTWGSVLP